jgi:hypothetical protein
VLSERTVIDIQRRLDVEFERALVEVRRSDRYEFAAAISIYCAASSDRIRTSAHRSAAVPNRREATAPNRCSPSVSDAQLDAALAPPAAPQHQRIGDEVGGADDLHGGSDDGQIIRCMLSPPPDGELMNTLASIDRLVDAGEIVRR